MNEFLSGFILGGVVFTTVVTIYFSIKEDRILKDFKTTIHREQQQNDLLRKVLSESLEVDSTERESLSKTYQKLIKGMEN